MLFSTTTLPDPTPKPGEWWYYGLDHGQHIAFYSRQTFEKIASQFGCSYHTDGKYIHLADEKETLKRLVPVFDLAGRVYPAAGGFSDQQVPDENGLYEDVATVIVRARQKNYPQLTNNSVSLAQIITI